jgi:hypothetical protein
MSTRTILCDCRFPGYQVKARSLTGSELVKKRANSAYSAPFPHDSLPVAFRSRGQWLTRYCYGMG